MIIGPFNLLIRFVILFNLIGYYSLVAVALSLLIVYGITFVEKFNRDQDK